MRVVATRTVVATLVVLQLAARGRTTRLG